MRIEAMPVARAPVADSLSPVAPAPRKPRLTPRRGLKREWLFGALLVVVDVVIFGCAYLGFLRLRLDGPVDVVTPGLSNLAPLLLCLGAIGVVFIAASRYTLRFDMDSVRFAAEHGLACLTAFALALLLQFAVFLFDFSRSRAALLGAFLVFAPLTLLFRRILGRSFRARAETQTFLVLGAGEAAIRFYRACRENGTAQNLRFVDLGCGHPGGRLDGPNSPFVDRGAGKDFPDLLDGSVEAVVVPETFPALTPDGVEALVRIHFDHAPILTLEAFYEKYWRKIPVGTMDPLWALRQDFRLARDSSYRFFKRAVDIVLSGAGLLLALPLLALCAAAIGLESGGRILYRQTRLRRDRRTFTLYKFRTMRSNTEEEEATRDLYTRDEDLRVTHVGRWLRMARLDELPQLWNVLRGEMSLIGPRAEWVRCVEIYEREIPGYHLRHLVKPGITGWAQVNYPYGRSIADTVEKLKYDLYYIKNYSLLLDASIVLKTLYVILTCAGK